MAGEEEDGLGERVVFMVVNCLGLVLVSMLIRVMWRSHDNNTTSFESLGSIFL